MNQQFLFWIFQVYLPLASCNINIIKEQCPQRAAPWITKIKAYSKKQIQLHNCTVLYRSTPNFKQITSLCEYRPSCTTKKMNARKPARICNPSRPVVSPSIYHAKRSADQMRSFSIRKSDLPHTAAVHPIRSYFSLLNVVLVKRIFAPRTELAGTVAPQAHFQPLAADCCTGWACICCAALTPLPPALPC